MGNTLAIRGFYTGVRPISDLKIVKALSRLRKRVLSKFSVLLSSKLRTDMKEVEQAVRKIIAHIKTKEPKLREDQDKVTIVVARNNLEAAENSYEGWENVFDEEIKQEKISIRRLKPRKGEYDGRFKRIIINLQEIRRNCKTEEEIKASVILTTTHELFHHFGDFSHKLQHLGKTYRSEWLNDGLCELLARRVMEKICPNEFDDLGKKDNEEYRNYIEAVSELISLVGEETLTTAFFNNNFGLVMDKLEELGFGEAEIQELLDVGSQCDSKEGLNRFRKLVKKLKKKLKEDEPEQKGPLETDHPDKKKDSDGPEKPHSKIQAGKAQRSGRNYSARYYEDCRRKLAELNFRNPEAMKMAEQALWKFMAVSYEEHLGGRPHLKVPRVAVLRNRQFLGRFGKIKDSIYGCFVAEENRIYFNYDEIRDLDQGRKILLFIHETAHSFFSLNKGDFRIRDEFTNTLSEAATNVIAGEVFSELFPDAEVDPEYRNFLELGKRVSKGIGRERLYNWYFGNDPESLFADINKRYGFGADVILRAASSQTDAPTTLTFAVLNNLERAEDKSIPRIRIPKQGFDNRVFAAYFQKNPLSAVYYALNRILPHINPHKQAMLAGDIAYRCFADAHKRKPVETALDILSSARSVFNDIDAMRLRWAITYDLYEQIRVNPRIAGSLHSHSIMEELAFRRFLMGEQVTVDAVTESMLRISEDVSKYHSDPEIQRGEVLSAFRRDILTEALSLDRNIEIKAAEINPDSIDPFYVRSRVEERTIETAVGNAVIPVAVPATFTDKDIRNVPNLLSSVDGYLRMGDETVAAEENYLSRFIPTSYDLFASTYSAAGIIAEREFGAEGARLVQNLAVAPDSSSIILMYEIAALAKECVPARSYSYGSVVSG